MLNNDEYVIHNTNIHRTDQSTSLNFSVIIDKLLRDHRLLKDHSLHQETLLPIARSSFIKHNIMVQKEKIKTDADAVCTRRKTT